MESPLTSVEDCDTMTMNGRLEQSYEKLAFKYDQNKGNSGLYPYLIRGMVGKGLEEVDVLDIGAGPGAVAAMLVDAGVRTVTVMEPSRAMMTAAQSKLEAAIASGRVHTKLAGLPQLDFHANSFHVAMMNMVIHLVDVHDVVVAEEERKPALLAPAVYPRILESFLETYRVLKPGGVLFINSGLPHQLRYGRWYAEFFPWRTAYSYPRQPNRDEFEVLLKRAGFTEIFTVVDMDCPLLDESVVNDPCGIESEDWRVCDSDFLTLSEEELTDTLEKVRKARENGQLEQIMNQAKHYRQRMGQMTTFIARKCD